MATDQEIIPITGEPPPAKPARPRETLCDKTPGKPTADSDLQFELDDRPASLGDESTRATITWHTGPTRPCAFPAPALEYTADLPRDFGKYELLNEIGRGGMGVVYRARHKELDRIVAIKMILSNHLATPVQVERFYTEARAAAKLRSPFIVGIHEVGQHLGQHYYAMDYMPGGSLADLTDKGAISEEQAARYVLDVARAVQDLHDQGVLHRDLKPPNVLLDAAGRPCLTDFGLAKFLQAEGQVTRSGAIVGTPGYMAPEQAAGKVRELTTRSDIFSLGAILYELLTGRPPYTGETPLDTLVHVLEGEPIRPRRLRPALSRSIERVCLKCLERNPADRYQSASDLAEDLERYLRGERVQADRAGLWHRIQLWARREPALVSRLGTMGICGGIIQASHYLISPLEPLPHRQSLAVVFAWALCSLFFQRLLHRDRYDSAARYAWAAADVLLYTLLVAINHGLSTSLVAGYFLLVAASGLWFREHLVWITTAMSVVGYGVLVLTNSATSTSPAGLESPYRHVVFTAALAVAGLITGHQVQRTRALSRYYESRPLP